MSRLNLYNGENRTSLVSVQLLFKIILRNRFRIAVALRHVGADFPHQLHIIVRLYALTHNLRIQLSSEIDNSTHNHHLTVSVFPI